MKISVITINYNNAAGLRQTVHSVLTQSFKDFEYIIIDGGSTDGSKALLEEYSEKLGYWVSERDEGVYDAMNNGIIQASGEFCIFLNSGDYFVNDDVLTNAINVVKKNAADIYYGDIEIEPEEGKRICKKHPQKISLDLLEKETINHQASLIKRTLFDELGLYDLRYSMAADHAFYIKAVLHQKSFFYINQAMVFYELDGMSSRNFECYSIQMKAICENYIPGYKKRKEMEAIENARIYNQPRQRIERFMRRRYKQLRSFLQKW